MQRSSSWRSDTVLHYHLRFYQLLGLHAVPLNCRTGRSERLLRLWAGCLLAGFTCMALVCVSSGEVLHKSDHFGHFNDALKFAFAELAVLSIYWETIFHRRHLSRFWQLHTMMGTPAKLGRYLCMFYGTLSFELMLLLMLVYVQQLTRQLFLFWCTFQPFVFLAHLRNTQFVLHLELLRQQLLQLERELALLAEYSNFAQRFDGFECYMRRRLRQQQLNYARIYDMCVCFSSCFSYSVLTVLLMIFIRIAVDCYFMYYTIYNNIDNIDYYLLLPAILEIPAFIFTSQSCMRLVPRIAFQLHNILCSSSSLSLQLQNFSLQILHQPVRFDCFGTIVLDNYLLTRVACSICTYMIFTVQFMPKLNINQLR